jgi:hypothetical protein
MTSIHKINDLFYSTRNGIAEMLAVSLSTVSRMITDNVRRIEHEETDMYCLNDLPRCADIVREEQHKERIKAIQSSVEELDALRSDYKVLQQENEQNKAKLLDAQLNTVEANSFIQYIQSKTVTQYMMLFIIVATLFITFYEVLHLPKFSNLNSFELVAYIPILLFSVTMSVAVIWTAFNKSNRRFVDNLTLFVFVGVEFSSSANFFGLNEVLQHGTFLQIVITIFLSIGLPTLSIRLANSQANASKQLSTQDVIAAFQKVDKDLSSLNNFKKHLIK